VFVLVGIAYFPIGFAQLTGSVHIGQELVADHLDRLTVERKTAFGSLLEVLTIRPAGMLLPGRQMPIPTHHPHTGSFLLRLVEATREGRRQVREKIDAHGFHDQSLRQRLPPDTKVVPWFFLRSKKTETRHGALIPIPSPGWEFSRPVLKMTQVCSSFER
jgi:hypothetical protein